MQSQGKINIRGVIFQNLTPNEAFLHATELLNSEDGIKTIFTPNSEIVQQCIENPELFPIINSADMVIADGIGVVKAAEILGTPLKGKVAGIELGEKLLEYCSKSKIPVFFMGGKPEIAEKAAEHMSKKYPGLRVVGCQDGYFEKSGEENLSVISDINDSGAKLLFVCFGAPAQEKWIYANKHELKNVRLCLGLGGSLDIYSGTLNRAPAPFIKTNTEWLYRLIRQPSRFARMSKIPIFLLRTKEHAKKQKSSAGKQ